jgi:hypothetical protein
MKKYEKMNPQDNSIRNTLSGASPVSVPFIAVSLILQGDILEELAAVKKEFIEITLVPDTGVPCRQQRYLATQTFTLTDALEYDVGDCIFLRLFDGVGTVSAVSLGFHRDRAVQLGTHTFGFVFIIAGYFRPVTIAVQHEYKINAKGKRYIFNALHHGDTPADAGLQPVSNRS